MITNSFRGDIKFIFNKIKNRDKFSFSKFADGEYEVLRNNKITNCDNWTFDPKIHNKEHELLTNAFKYKHHNYYVGISCKCCQPDLNVEWMRQNVGTENVTWANIFVNDNYLYFIDNFIPEFNSWDGEVIVIANENGSAEDLPFKVDMYYPIDLHSWKYMNINTIIKNLKEKLNENQLFLFSGGMVGNILAHRLHEENKNNTYLDIGSTINPWIVGNNRGYLRNRNSKKKCIW